MFKLKGFNFHLKIIVKSFVKPQQNCQLKTYLEQFIQTLETPPEFRIWDLNYKTLTTVIVSVPYLITTSLIFAGKS